MHMCHIVCDDSNVVSFRVGKRTWLHTCLSASTGLWADVLSHRMATIACFLDCSAAWDWNSELGQLLRCAILATTVGSHLLLLLSLAFIVALLTVAAVRIRSLATQIILISADVSTLGLVWCTH